MMSLDVFDSTGMVITLKPMKTVSDVVRAKRSLALAPLQFPMDFLGLHFDIRRIVASRQPRVAAQSKVLPT